MTDAHPGCWRLNWVNSFYPRQEHVDVHVGFSCLLSLSCELLKRTRFNLFFRFTEIQFAEKYLFQKILLLKKYHTIYSLQILSMTDSFLRRLSLVDLPSIDGLFEFSLENATLTLLWVFFVIVYSSV